MSDKRRYRRAPVEVPVEFTPGDPKSAARNPPSQRSRSVELRHAAADRRRSLQQLYVQAQTKSEQGHIARHYLPVIGSIRSLPSRAALPRSLPEGKARPTIIRDRGAWLP